MANPVPDSNFRLSVEIINASQANQSPPNGYATLHWTGTAWFIGGSSFPPASDPTDFIGLAHKYGLIDTDSAVISLTVGNTQTPAGTAETTVSSVTFGGKAYDLSCRAVTPPVPEITELTAACVDGRWTLKPGRLEVPSAPNLSYLFQTPGGQPSQTPATVVDEPINGPGAVKVFFQPAANSYIDDETASSLKDGWWEYDAKAPATQECPEATPTQSTAPGSLATTGSDTPLLFGIAGAALAAVGAVVLILARRRRGAARGAA